MIVRWHIIVVTTRALNPANLINLGLSHQFLHDTPDPVAKEFHPDIMHRVINPSTEANPSPSSTGTLDYHKLDNHLNITLPHYSSYYGSLYSVMI